MKLRTEAPVNGGRNYNGPKVNNSLALVKLNYMRENSQTAVQYSLSNMAAVKIWQTRGQSAGKAPHGEPSETSRSATAFKAGGAMGGRICRR